MQFGVKTFTLIEFSTTYKTNGSNSGPSCCSTNTTIFINMFGKVDISWEPVEWPSVQQNILITTTQPTVETT